MLQWKPRPSGARSELVLTVVLGVWLGMPAGGQELFQSSPAYAEETQKLRGAKEQQYNFTRAQLRDVLRFLAEDCGINYMALPEAEGDKDKLITFNIVASPFAALETVSASYGVALILDQGIWHMRPLDDKQLIGRNYHLKYNPQEQVTTVSSTDGSSFGPLSRDSFSSNLSGEGSMGGMGGSMGGMSGGMSGGMGGGMGGGQSISLQGGPISHLASNAQQLVSDIEKILGIQTRGLEFNSTKKDMTVDNFGTDPMNTPQKVYNTAEEEDTDDKTSEDSEPAVFWNSDTNNLFVVCTRQQHQMIEHYLSTVDRPQPLIAVEVKFFETTSDPRKQFGVDWSETLDGGLPVRFNPVTPEAVNLVAPDGIPEDGWAALINWEDPSNSAYPQGAVLSSRAASVKIQALLADRNTNSTSYPRVLTQNNREAVIRNVINKPVLAASSSTTPGVGGTTTASVQYLPIGTTINILPKVLSDGTVALTVTLQLSNIIGSEIIGGNPYPVASSRLYTAPLKVESGYTVAIAGLDEAFDSREGTGIPVLSKIPLLGHAFKNTQRERAKKSLMMFITPTVLPNDTPGLPEKPLSTLPVRKEDPKIIAPQIYADGSLVGGIDKLPDAILWIDRQERFLRRLIQEQRAVPGTLKDIALLRRVCKALNAYVIHEQAAQPERAPELAVHRDNIHKVTLRAFDLKCENFKHSYSDFLGY
jgi:type II secretory pathway component GspD/PulD (secretin)